MTSSATYILFSAKLSDSRIEVLQPFTGSKSRGQHDKNAEFVTMFDFSGITGDGVSNDSAGLSVIESLATAPVIYGLGNTFKVDAVPTAKRYSDGWWLVGSSLIPFDFVSVVRASNNIISLGANAGASVAGARNCIAIGQDAMRYNVFGRHNICMGISAGMYLNGLNASSIEGSRNLLLGGNAGRFMTTANRNIVLGRDAGHNITTGSLNIIIGNGAVMGDGPNTLNPGVIENQTPLNPSYVVMIGTEAGKYYNSGYAVGIGHNALQNTKTDASIVGIGPLAFQNYQSDVSYWGTTQSVVALAGTYSQTTSTTISVNSPSHGLTTGFRVLLRFTTGAHADTTFMDDNWYLVTVGDGDNFTIQSPVIAAATGNLTISKISNNTPYSGFFGGVVGIGRGVGNGISNYRSVGIGDLAGSKGLGVENIAIGYNVHTTNVPGAGNTAIGAYSQMVATSSAGGNTSIGVLTLNGLTVGTNNTATGAQSMRLLTTGSNNTATGSGALRGLTTGTTNTALGVDALRFTSTGADHNFSNSTGLGFNAVVSGDNQLQLGNSFSSPYAFAALQLRSDSRDKVEVRDTDLGIEFIMGLRPVRGKWNLRDDYVEQYEVQIGIDLETALPIFETRTWFNQEDYEAKTKKRVREHDWFLAQEVAALCKKLGVDFAGLQHAEVNGGEDVYSLSYTDFVPPLTKSVQQCWTRLDELEARIKELESK